MDKYAHHGPHLQHILHLQKCQVGVGHEDITKASLPNILYSYRKTFITMARISPRLSPSAVSLEGNF